MIQNTWQRFNSRPLRKAYNSQDQSYSSGGQASSSGGQPRPNGGHSLSSGGNCSSGDDFSKLEPPALCPPVLQSEQTMRKPYGTGLEFVQTFSEEAVHAQRLGGENAVNVQQSWARKTAHEQNIHRENAAHAQESWSQKASHALKIGSENAAHAQDSWSQKAAHALKISSENAAHAQGIRNVKASHEQEEDEGADLSLVLRTLEQHGLSEVRAASLIQFLIFVISNFWPGNSAFPLDPNNISFFLTIYLSAQNKYLLTMPRC
jgi:hypothetical protein